MYFIHIFVFWFLFLFVCSPGCLTGVECVNMLSQHYLRLVLKILNLFWVFESTCLCFNVRASLYQLQQYIEIIYRQKIYSSFIPQRSENPPGLKRTIALRQANSVGSTCRALNRLKSSCRRRRSEAQGLFLPCEEGDSSGRESRGQLSSGRDHWMAQRRNSSLHASSSNITYINIEAEDVKMVMSCKLQALK